MNDYVICYDKGIKKDRSSLIISKYNNSNLYVLTELYDEKADLINEIITSFQQENKQLKKANNYLQDELYDLKREKTQSYYHSENVKLRKINNNYKIILVELEEWCNDGIKDEMVKIDYGTEIIGEPIKIHIASYEMILDKIQKLKEKYKCQVLEI